MRLREAAADSALIERSSGITLSNGSAPGRRAKPAGAGWRGWAGGDRKNVQDLRSRRFILSGSVDDFFAELLVKINGGSLRVTPHQRGTVAPQSSVGTRSCQMAPARSPER